MRIPFCAIGMLLPALALASEPLRPSAELLTKPPEWLMPGQCVRYIEGGGGRLLVAPSYFLQGEVISTRIEQRTQAGCAEISPCVAVQAAAEMPKMGYVRLRVRDWDTPHASANKNQGRLYRGHFLEQKLESGMDIELEADLLGPCAP